MSASYSASLISGSQFISLRGKIIQMAWDAALVEDKAPLPATMLDKGEVVKRPTHKPRQLEETQIFKARQPAETPILKRQVAETQIYKLATLKSSYLQATLLRRRYERLTSLRRL